MMERLRETLSRLNPTVIGFNVVGLAIALFVLPHIMAGPVLIAPVAVPGIVAPQAAGPEQRPAPPVPQVAAPEQRPAPPVAQAVGPVSYAAKQPPLTLDGLPPAPPQPSWTRSIAGLLLNLFTMSSMMSLLASATLVGLLVW